MADGKPAVPARGKTVAIMQPYLFPYIPYFQLMDLADVFVILDDVSYINRGWINRNRILLAGQAHRITLQLRGASQNRRINEIEVGDNAGKLLRTIAHAYARAPNFGLVYPLIERVLLQPRKNLAAYLAVGLESVCRALGIATPMLFSSSLEMPADLAGQQRILAICRKLGARTYVNPEGGRGLYHHRAFAESGIGLFFLHGAPEPYRQASGTFQSGLSIIDAMMYCSPEELQHRIRQYRLVPAGEET
ncbi:MAG TPA: hypothetical protein ENK05_06210 [Gammaproteobacteria bacterium]|nr:hypothetical protein [Gammaproteobacteria bacterium]